MADAPPSPTVDCGRCGRNAPGATGVAYGGTLGAQIRAGVCQSCWQEWQNTEVMVINELRLDFMNPESQKILMQHLREFLALESPPA